VGHLLWSLNCRVSHMISKNSCGILTGCVDGHGAPVSKVPPTGYATWLLWFGLSRLTPSQHLLALVSWRAHASWLVEFLSYVGKKRLVRMPPGQGLFGK
jgi:hypothetical protein